MLALLLSLIVSTAPGGGAGKVFLTVEEALALAFPGCEVERATEFLSEAEEERVEELAHAALDGRVVRPYVAKKDGKLVGTAYFDAHVVRTKREVLMLVVAPDARLRRVEVLSFAEPLEYLPRAAFYAQFGGRPLDDELGKKGAIRGVAGATLSADAAIDAARRALAVHRVLAERTHAAGAALAGRTPAPRLPAPTPR
jgi:hypothetical protein